MYRCRLVYGEACWIFKGTDNLRSKVYCKRRISSLNQNVFKEAKTKNNLNRCTSLIFQSTLRTLSFETLAALSLNLKRLMF